MMEHIKTGFRVDPGRPAAIVSMAAFGLTVPTQIVGYAGRLNEPVVAAGLVLLPVLSAFLMILAILQFGRERLWLSIFPVFIGVLGFAFKLAIDPRETGLLHHVSAVALYAGIVTLWALTVLYVIKTRVVLTLLFLVSFLKHIIVNDLPVLLGFAPQDRKSVV